MKQFEAFVEPVEVDVVIAQNELFADSLQVRYRERGGTPVTTAQPNIADERAWSIPKTAHVAISSLLAARTKIDRKTRTPSPEKSHGHGAGLIRRLLPRHEDTSFMPAQKLNH